MLIVLSVLLTIARLALLVLAGQLLLQTRVDQSGHWRRRHVLLCAGIVVLALVKL